MANARIRTCTEKDIGLLTEIIRSSFRDVADRFGLTRENAPRHPSNCTEDWIQRDMDRGDTYFILEDEGIASGCAAMERASPDVCYLKRLAVLPPQRRHRFGRILVDHVLGEAKRFGAHRLSIGIIAEQPELKEWYRNIGFIETETKKYAQLPFGVTFMSCEIDRN